MQGWVGSTGAAHKKAALDNVQWRPRQRNTWPLLSRSEQVTHLQAENRPQLKHERPHLYRDWNWLINQNCLTSNICCRYDCYTLGQWFRRVTRKFDSSLDDYSKQQPSSTGSVSIWVTKRRTHHSGSKTAKSNQWNQSCRSSSLALLASLPFSFTPDYFPLSEKKPVPIPAQFQYIPSKRTGQASLPLSQEINHNRSVSFMTCHAISNIPPPPHPFFCFVILSFWECSLHNSTSV